MKKIVTLLIGLLLVSLDTRADETVELYVGEKELLNATFKMNLSNAISNVHWEIDASKLYYREESWTVVVAPTKYYDGEATVKCSWVEKDQSKPIPYPTYYKSYTWKIRCKDNPIVLYTTEIRLQPGEYGNIRVDCTNSDVSYFYNCRYEWHFSTKNSSVANVQQTGLVEAVGPGQTEIVISSPNAKDDKYCKVIVESAPNDPIPVTSITLNKTSLSLEKDKSETLTATVKPDNATDKTVTWSSSDKDIATVDENGKVTAVADGTATITCKANDSSGKQATCAVTVTSGNNQSKKGDVNGDGQVTGTDLVALTNIILGKSAKKDAADLNGDGQVNGTDFVKLVNMILGK